jgi:transposase
MSKSSEKWYIPDELWSRIEPLLPAPKPHPPGCHKPRVANRAAMNAIFFKLRPVRVTR